MPTRQELGTVVAMILITGATGTIGSTVLRLLAARDVPVRAMSRDPQRVQAGFEVSRGDFEDPASLEQALHGVHTVFLLSAPGATIPAHDQALLAAAKNVRKVVKVSAIGTGEPGFESTSGWHLPGEQALRRSGLDWTVLRPSMFASNSRQWIGPIQAGAPLPNMFGAGTNGVVDPRDVAAVAVETLLSDKHNGQVYTLTGPELLSVPDQVAQLGEVLGRSLETVDVPVAQARAGMLAQGVPSAAVDMQMAGLEFVRAGGNAILTGDVEQVLGRSPGTFKAWAQDNRELFA
jgi:uncharacterized protein YbjT (DUF2867 family)